MRIEEAIRQPKFRNNFQRALINLLYTSNWLRDVRVQMFKPYGLNPQQYNVLRILNGKHPDPCTAGEIKRVMLDKSPDLTRLIDKLCERGLVNREICAENRRKMDITIRDDGIELLGQIKPAVDHLTDSKKLLMLKPWSSAESSINYGHETLLSFIAYAGPAFGNSFQRLGTRAAHRSIALKS